MRCIQNVFDSSRIFEVKSKSKSKSLTLRRRGESRYVQRVRSRDDRLTLRDTVVCVCVYVCVCFARKSNALFKSCWLMTWVLTESTVYCCISPCALYSICMMCYCIGADLVSWVHKHVDCVDTGTLFTIIWSERANTQNWTCTVQYSTCTLYSTIEFSRCIVQCTRTCASTARPAYRNRRFYCRAASRARAFSFSFSFTSLSRTVCLLIVVWAGGHIA